MLSRITEQAPSAWPPCWGDSLSSNALLRTAKVLVQRKLRQAWGRPAPFSQSPGRRVLLLTEPGPIPQSQVFPFHFYAAELARRWGVQIREMATQAFEARPDAAPGPADVVCVQTWFDLDAERCDRLFAAIRTGHPAAKIVFLDWYAPTDLRLAAMLDRHIDVYVKKHVFRDRSRYAQATLGDTNLVDYYGRLYGHDHAEVVHHVPPGFLDKLVVGPSFFTSQAMLPHFFGSARPAQKATGIDVHARLGGSGGGWYQTMREQAVAKVESTPNCNVVSGFGIGNRQYLNELRRSRLCFSPFGYGEVCWRDYEAIMCGAVLIKPSMSHIETAPDIFVDHQTYLSIAWDFSDLHEVIARALSDSKLRDALARRAHDVLHDHARHARFVDQMAPLFSP